MCIKLTQSFQMQSTCGLLVLLGLALVVADKFETPHIRRLKQTSVLLSSENPRSSPACFDLYTPKLNDISRQYEVEYNQCNSEYENQTLLDNSHWQAQRQQLVSSGDYACSLMVDCSTIVGYVEAFECYADVSAKQSKIMYTISANATQTAVNVQLFDDTLEIQQKICINNAERQYVEDTTSTYEALNSCLTGKIEISTSTRATTTTVNWMTTTSPKIP